MTRRNLARRIERVYILAPVRGWMYVFAGILCVWGRVKIVLDARICIFSKKRTDKSRSVGFGSLREVRGAWCWLGSYPDRASEVTRSEQGEGCTLAARTCLSEPGDRAPHLLGSNHMRAQTRGDFFWLVTFLNSWNYSSTILMFSLIFRGNSFM